MTQRASFPIGWTPLFRPHSHSEGHDLKKQTTFQKSKAIASSTHDRALILRKPRAVKFSTCPLNAPVRGVSDTRVGTPEHFMCLIFSSPSNVVSTPTKRWLATALLVHRVRKKGATLFLPVTPRNANPFLKFFYHHALQ